MSNLTLLRKGQPIPSFSFKEADGTERNSRDLAGAFSVIYFYPKDDTPGCTKEACGFRDQHQKYVDQGIKVIGVSPDDEASHQKFRQKFALPFALGSDTDHEIAKAFGAWGPKTRMGRTYEGVHRVTFLIDQENRVAHVYPKVQPEQHAEEILRDAAQLS